MNSKTECSSVSVQSVKNQYFAAAAVNLLGISCGLIEGWSTPSIFLLTSENSPLPSGKITMEEASWIASLLSIGSILGVFCFGFITKTFSRKLPCIIITFPSIMCWLLMWFAQNVYYLYAARTLSGFLVGGGYAIAGLFLCEISCDRIRGALISSCGFGEYFGILLAIVGYYDTPKLGIFLMICLGVSMCFFPETPIFLLKQGKIADAEISIGFYRSLQQTESDQEKLQYEIDKMKRTINDDESESNNEKSLRWMDFTEGVGRKAILIGMFLMVINQLTGVYAMIGYSSFIFEQAKSNLSPEMSTIILGIIQLVGVGVVLCVVDRFGKKLLLLISTVGAALGLIILGVYMMLISWNYNVEALNWLPLISFSFIVFVSSLGISTLTWAIVPEIMPEKMKEFGVSFCLALMSAFSFIILKFMPLLLDSLGFHGAIYLFALICFCGTVFVIFVLPETSCKSHEEIMKSLE